MTKQSRQRLFAGLLSFLCSVLLLTPVGQAAETLHDYQATYTVKDDGSITITEQFTYPVSAPIDHIDHRIGLNDSSQLEDLAITMRASNQSQAFPFVEGEAKDVGTYHLAKAGNDITLTLYNQMAKDNEIITTAAQLKNAWVKYDQQNILEFPLLRVPHQVQNAHIKLVLPGDVNPNDVALMTTGAPGVDRWWQDKRTLVLEIPQAKPNEGVNLTMSVPNALLKNNQNEGPESKGEQILQRMATEKQAQAQRDQWKRVLLWAILIAVGVILLGYSFLLFRKKQHYRQTTQTYASGQLDYEMQSPAVLAKLLNLSLSGERALWMTLFHLIAKEQLLVRWQLDKEGQLVDAWFTIRDQQADNALAQLVLDALIHTQGGGEVSFQAFKYQQRQAKRASRTYRQLLRQLKRGVDAVMTKRQLLVKRATWIFGLGWWLCVIVVLTGALAQFLLMTMVHHSYWMLLVMGLYLVWLVVMKRYALPIYSSAGLDLRQYWHDYFKRLPSGAKQGEPVWNWTMDYLYSWLVGKNQRQYRLLKQQGLDQQVTFVRQLAPVSQSQLKNFK